MSNRLNMAEHQTILGLARLNWSRRRIAAELKIDRETVSRHLRTAAMEASVADPPDPNAAIPITGSTGIAVDNSDGGIPAAESNATNVMTGSTPPSTSGSSGRQSQCDPWRAIITAGVERGLTARRIWQDLSAEHGFERDYQSVQRFVRRLKEQAPLPFRRMECEPGEEAQVDFGKGCRSSVPKAGGRVRICFGSC